MYYLFVITLIQSVVSKPSKRKDVLYEMSSTCPECEMRFTRIDNMKRHFHSRHESMKFFSPPPKETGYDYTPLPPPNETRYDYTPPPPPRPPKKTCYDCTPPPSRASRMIRLHSSFEGNTLRLYSSVSPSSRKIRLHPSYSS